MTHLVPYLHNFKNQKSHFSTMRSASEASYVKIQNIFAPRIFQFFFFKKIWNFSNYKRERAKVTKVWKSKNFENLKILII